jgi:diguanylate cyclase (GGDEF)-like protein
VLGDIWVREDPEAASADAVVAANALGLGGATIAGVLEAISLDLQALAPVFEVSLREPEAMELLLEQAKETALLRSIQMIGDSSRLSGAAESLEERARVLEEQARRDGLTGLYNRRYLDERLAEELSNARTHGWPLAIAFIDLDLFKRVNDTYGHQAGDEVLRGAARLLLAGTRSSDVVARFGGEEFLILLPGTGLASALVVTERLVASFRESRHAVAGHQEVRVTISVGLAVQGEGQDFESPEELVRAADRAVYAAKRLGRDRWVVYGSDKAV